jgi:hypothetical protein
MRDSTKGLCKFVARLRVERNYRRTIMPNFAGTLIVDSIGVGWRPPDSPIGC